MFVYLITDGKGNYIKSDFSNRYTRTTNEALAETWTSKKCALNVLNSNLSKAQRGKYKVVCVSDSEKRVNTDFKTVAELREPFKEGQKRYPTSSEEVSDEEFASLWIDEWCTKIMGLRDDVERNINEMRNKLSDVDKRVCDIRHYIEFGKLNAYQGWEAYSVLHRTLQNRRKIKNRLATLFILRHTVDEESFRNKILSSVCNLQNQSCEPKTDVNLFTKIEKGIVYEA